MFMLTRVEGDIESGTYATIDEDGTPCVQFFVDKDDAMTYSVQLSAVGYDLEVTETPDEAVDKICDILGYAYTVAEPGEFVIPKMEILQKELENLDLGNF